MENSLTSPMVNTKYSVHNRHEKIMPTSCSDNMDIILHSKILWLCFELFGYRG